MEPASSAIFGVFLVNKKLFWEFGEGAWRSVYRFLESYRWKTFGGIYDQVIEVRGDVYWLVQ